MKHCPQLILAVRSRVWLAMLICVLQASCTKAPPAPPAVAPAAAAKKPQKSVAEINAKLYGTPEYNARIKAEREKELADLEAPLFQAIEKNWDKSLKHYQQTAVKEFDLETIPDLPGVETELQFQKFMYELRLKEVSAYRELTQDPPEARDAAMKFLDAYVFTQARQRAPDGPALEELEAAALKAGAKDPIVRLYAKIPALMNADNPSPEETKAAYQTLTEIYPVMRERKYPKYLIFQAKLFAWRLAKKNFSPAWQPDAQYPINPAPKLLTELSTPWVEWLAEVKPEHFSATWLRMGSVTGEWTGEEAQDKYVAMLRNPDIDPWLKHMFGGYCHSTLGWESRGHGLAKNVTEQGWKDLAQHGAIAERHALYAWQLQPKLVDAPVLMMSLTLTESQMGTPRDWFARAISLRYDSADAYNRLEQSLRPRWGGSIEQLTTFALACLKLRRFDTYYTGYGLNLLTRIQSQELGATGSLFDDSRVLPALLEHVDALNKAVAEAGPGSTLLADHLHNYQTLAHLFIKAGDYQHARIVMEPIVGELAKGGFSVFGFDVVYQTGRTLASIPELEEPLSRIDAMLKTGAGPDASPDSFDPVLQDLARVRQAFGIAEAEPPLTEAAWMAAATDAKTAKTAWISRFVRHVETAVQRLKKFATGEWVELTVDDLMLGWSVDAASWKVTAPDTIQINADQSYLRYRLISLARFEPPYDVQVTADEVLVKPEFTVTTVGVALGAPATSATLARNGMRQFGIHPNSRMAAIWRLRDETVPPHTMVPKNGKPGVEQPEVVRVKVWPGGHYSFYVNNYRVEYQADPSFDPGRDVTFGDALRFSKPGAISLSKMRIRKLNYAAPQPNRQDYPAEETFARSEIQFDPDDASAHLDLGNSLLMQHKFAPALAALQKAEQLQPMLSVYDLNLMLGICYSRTGQHKLAVEKFQVQAARPNEQRPPELTAMMNREVAFLRATAPVDELRNGKYAMTLIMPLNEQTKFANWDYLWVLSTVHAELGEFDEALKRIREARVLAPEDQKEFLGKVEKLFENKQPYRDETKSDSTTNTKTN